MTHEERFCMEDTLAHIRLFQTYMRWAIDMLMNQMIWHDHSKLSPEAFDTFVEYGPKLRNCTYGSEEYKGFLAGMKKALDYHYEQEDHHPEHHEDGIRRMDLISILAMFLDWRSATERHHDGDIRRSIEHNQKRFGYSDDVKQILLNTCDLLDRFPTGRRET